MASMNMSFNSTEILLHLPIFSPFQQSYFFKTILPFLYCLYDNLTRVIQNNSGYVFPVCFAWYLYHYTFFIIRGLDMSFLPFPILGNNLNLFINILNPFDQTKLIYNRAKKLGVELIGWFDTTIPVVCLCSNDLVKSALYNNTKNFRDHRCFTHSMDMASKGLFQLTGEDWKKKRDYLNKTFSVKELSNLLSLLIPLCRNLDNYLFEKYEEKKTANEGKLDCQYYEDFIMEINIKDVFSRITLDGILSCVFGIEQNTFSQDEEAHENYKHGANVANVVGGFRWVKFFVINWCFKLTEWLFPGGIYDEESRDYLLEKFNRKYSERASGKVYRQDILQHLFEGQRTKGLSEEEIQAHAMLFFFAGFDTVSTCLSLTALQLAEHPLVQNKLFQEINRIQLFNRDESKKCFYDRLLELQYMDCVITESLRRYPVIVELDRVCTKEFTFKTNKESYNIKLNERINVPIMGFQRDPENFTQPNLFIPERHTKSREANKEDPNFLAFGVGPRKCLGFRFARMEIKLILAMILRHFEFVATNATPLPMVLKKTFEIYPEPNGFIVGLRRRVKHDSNPEIFYPTIISREDLAIYQQKLQIEATQGNN